MENVNETIPAWAMWVPVVSAAVGGFVAVIGNVINNMISKRAEVNKQVREAVIRTAIDNWSRDSEYVIRNGGELPPIESYVFHMALLSDILLDPDKITEQSVLDRLEKSKAIISVHRKFAKEEKHE